jgi:hypothetical protein
MMSASSRQVHSSTPPSRSAWAPGPTYGAVMEETMERIQAAYFGAETSRSCGGPALGVGVGQTGIF